MCLVNLKIGIIDSKELRGPLRMLPCKEMVLCVIVVQCVGCMLTFVAVR